MHAVFSPDDASTLGDGNPHHIPAASHLQHVWADGFQVAEQRFSFVRDPYARLVAVFRAIMDGSASSGMRVDNHWRRKIDALGGFSSLIRGPIKIQTESMTPTDGSNDGVHPYMRPQVERLFRGGSMLVTFAGRFENLERDLARVCREPSCASTLTSNSHDQQLSAEDVAQMYGNDAQLWRVMEKFYREDFERLGYPIVHSPEEYLATRAQVRQLEALS